MRRIAWASLFFDRSKLIAALCGIAFSATLTVVQTGLYAGFLKSCSAIIHGMGGDIWVMPVGTDVVDSVEILAASSRGVVASHPCVERVRPLIYNWAFFRKPNGTSEGIRMIGVDPVERPFVPWEMALGMPTDLAQPMRIALDEFDTKKLRLDDRPLGKRVTISGQTAYVAGLTRNIRSFTLLPFVFTNLASARRFAGMSAGQVNYWVLDLKDQRCIPDVIGSINQHHEMYAETRASFITRSNDYWVKGSGAGSVLAFSALLALVVGGVIVGQTLFMITREHQKELATLKAVGATARELVWFVGWQAALLTSAGTALGLGAGLMLGWLGRSNGLVLVFSPAVIASSVAIICLMCSLACVASVRQVLRIDAGEVFK